jgi:citronellol/citronellal dehydrogenase
MAEEFRGDGVAVNALWPRTAIDTAAISLIAGEETRQRRTRKAAIMADAAHAILTRPSRECTGRFFIDDEVLAEAGVTDLSPYLPEGAREDDLMADFFLD